MQKKGYVGIITLVLFILSFLILSQVKTTTESEADILKYEREDSLRDMVVSEREKSKNLSEKLDETEKKLKDYMDSISQTDKTVELLQKEINQINIMAGLTKVKGTGIMITMQDAETANPLVLAEEQIIHDTDISQIVNELKAAGAEAISVNEQRITSFTAIRCVGPTIMVNEVKIGSPFVIKAIGNSEYLNSGINLKNGVGDMLRRCGILVDVKQLDNVEIPKYEGAVKLMYAAENKEESK